MLNLTRCRLWAPTSLCLLAGSLLCGQTSVLPELPELTSDEQEFDSANNRMVAKGNAELSHGDILVRGDTIIFEQNEHTLKVQDNVTLTKDEFRLAGDFANYDYFQRSFLSENFRLGSYPVYVTGQKVGGTLDKVVVDKGRLYFQDPDPYALNLRAETLTLEDREYLVMDDVTFYIGDVPIFWLPHYEQNVKDDSPVRWRADAGFGNNLGVYMQNEVLFRVVPEVKVGANLDGYSKRGFLGGPIVEYDWKMDEESWQKGKINTGFIYDTGTTSERGTDSLGQQIGHSRNFIDWQHKGEIDGSIDLTSSLYWWSDSWITRDFRPGIFYDNQVPDSFAEGVYRGENWMTSVFMRYAPNDWEVIAQRFPEVSFDLLPTQVFDTGVYQRFNADFVRLVEKDPQGTIAQLESDRLNLFYSLTRPIELADWAILTPVAGGMVTNYAQTVNSQGSYTRVLGEIGADLELTMVGTWDYDNEFWGINGLRHTLRPIVQYRYIPHAQAGNTKIPQIDRQAAFETYLPPLELGDIRYIDDLYEVNTIRVGFENLFQTRHPEGYGSLDLVTLDIYEEFRFSPAPQQTVNVIGLPANTVIPAQDTFSDIYTDLTIYPAYWLNIEVFNRFDPEHLTNRQVSSRVTIHDSEEWALAFGNDYIQDLPGTPINQFAVEGEYRLNDRNLLRGLWRIDAHLSELTEQYYAWRTRLGNSWDVEIQLGYLQGTTRENDFQVRFRVDLLNF